MREVSKGTLYMGMSSRLEEERERKGERGEGESEGWGRE